MVREESSRVSKWWVVVIGAGFALSPIHNLWLTDLATNSKGETLFFLPAFGYLLLMMGTGLFLLYNWDKVKEIGWGDKRIVVPLLIIVAAIGLSGTTANGWQDKIAPLGMGIALFAVYLASRVLGKEVFLPLAIGAGIASLGIVIRGLVYPGQHTGGFIFEHNFDIATGYILLGVALFIHKWQWLLAGLAVIALLFSGAPEALFAMGVLGLTLLIRRDWSKRLMAIGTTTVLLIVVVFVVGWGQSLYSYVVRTVQQDPMAVYVAPSGETANVSPLTHRALVIRDALTSIKPLGEGYNLTGFTVHTVHNVPLIIIQQLGVPGILASVAWLWISMWCLVKTKTKYAWVLILTLSIFDHFVWSQLAPLWWMLAGVSATSTVGSDLIFRRAGYGQANVGLGMGN